MCYLATSQRFRITSIAAVGLDLIAPVEHSPARKTRVRILTALVFGYHTTVPYVIIGVITLVHI